ncbi:interleukin-12 subunit alpha-like [Salarias fasciatus]|uniref:interleukin-12 subunit alpha-like n=1 Tax=Salarias fasciatus TaxID=181472 RepID=UPI0011768739|nr:interleukin-12 subunit alpha-like [Salarias fasciatus]
MTLVKLCFTPALLLLLLPPLALAHPLGQPATIKEPATDSCLLYAQNLLHNITAALAQKDLFNGFSCSGKNMELNDETRTAAVCAPKGSTCSGRTDSKFDQDSCVTEIGKDLTHYYRFFTAQPNNIFLSEKVLPGLGELMTAAADAASSYDKRLKLCKVLRGFQVRLITINRALGYMKSGEHMK